MPQFVASAVLVVWGAMVASMPLWAPAVATAIGYAVVAAGALSLGRGLLKPKLPKGALNSNSPLQLSRDSTPPRRVVYGETRLSGPMLFAHTTGADNAYLHLIIGLAEGPVHSIGDTYFNTELVPLDGAGAATGTYAGLARVLKHLGDPDQAADATLIAEAGGAWTATDRLRGIAYAYARLKHDQNKWPGLPNISFVIKGRLLYDPRTETTAWSDNPALAIRDYLTNTRYGLAVSTDEIDEASFIAAANICDELVALDAGGTEKRYTVNGSFETTAEPATVLEKLTGAMAGMLTYVGGKWFCYAGAHRVPTITLDEGDLRGPISVQTKMSIRDTCNGVKGTFVSPAELWQTAEANPIVNAAYVAEDGGIELWRDLDLPFTNSPTMAQRLFKIELERSRDDMVVEYPAMLTGLLAKAGSVIMVNNTRYGWTEKQFIVTGLKLNVYDAAGAPALGVDLTLRSTRASNWSWTPGEEALYVPGSAVVLADPRTVAAATGLTLSTSNIRQADGTITPRLQLDWDAPGNLYVTRGGWWEIEYKRTADADWISWTKTHPGDATREYLTDVEAGVSYDVRIRPRNLYGVEAPAWLTETAVVSTDQTQPAAPTNLTATSSPGSVTLDWDDNTESDLRIYRVYRHTADSFGAASLVWAGRASAWTDFLVAAGTTFFYWVTAVDGTNNESDASAVASAAPNPATGNYVDYRFKRAATIPATPTGDNPAGWSDAPPADDGNPLWMSKAEKTSAGTLVGAWSTPIRLTGEDGVDGAAGANGTNGIDGVDGEDGKWVEFVWKRAATTPTTPTGNGIPAGWSDDPPAGSDPLWMSKAKQELDGTLVAGETWSAPIRHDGPPGAAGANGVDGDDGADGESMQVQYSSDGSSWHDPPFVGGSDLYMRQRIGASGTWSGAIRIVGETGAAGPALSYSLTIDWHASGLGGGTINGTPYSGTSTTVTGLNPGSWVDISADANVSGDSWTSWGGASTAQLEQGTGTNSNRILMGGNLSLIANY